MRGVIDTVIDVHNSSAPEVSVSRPTTSSSVESSSQTLQEGSVSVFNNSIAIVVITFCPSGPDTTRLEQLAEWPNERGFTVTVDSSEFELAWREHEGDTELAFIKCCNSIIARVRLDWLVPSNRLPSSTRGNHKAKHSSIAIIVRRETSDVIKTTNMATRLSVTFRIRLQSVCRLSSELHGTAITVLRASRPMATLSVQYHLFEDASHDCFAVQGDCKIDLSINLTTVDNRQSVHLAIRHTFMGNTILLQCHASRVADSSISLVMYSGHRGDRDFRGLDNRSSSDVDKRSAKITTHFAHTTTSNSVILEGHT
jgi:hypothetical protein